MVSHRPPVTHTTVPAAESGFVENEAEMDISIPAFNPLGAAGVVDQIHASFRGVDRKTPKTTIATAPAETFTDLAALVATLPSDAAMRNHQPAIARNIMTRANEEQRNVKVLAWIYAIKYEADQDWHVIIGTRPSDATKTFFNAEISGLPTATATAHDTLLKVRTKLAAILNNQLPAADSYFKYDTPIPIKWRVPSFSTSITRRESWDLTGCGPKPLGRSIPSPNCPCNRRCFPSTLP